LRTAAEALVNLRRSSHAIRAVAETGMDGGVRKHITGADDHGCGFVESVNDLPGMVRGISGRTTPINSGVAPKE
jgi:hypothetical protein